jgi:hypothetical protein
MARDDVHAVMPNGWCFHYKDETHHYWSCSGDPDHRRCQPRWPSCSGLGKGLDQNNDPLLHWAAKLTREGIAKLATQVVNPAWIYDADKIKSELYRNKMTWTHLRDAAGVRGTNAHDYFEKRALGADVGEMFEVYSNLADDEIGYADSLETWWRENDPRTMNVEQFVMSKAHRYTGRFDWRGEVDGRVFLLDVKTSRFIRPSFHAQLRLYDIAARECGVGESDELVMLQALPSGEKAIEVRCAVSEQEAIDCISVARTARRLEKAA